jgi:hypothetical protein
MKHTVNGFVTYKKQSWDNEPIISFSTHEPCKYGSPEIVTVGTHSMEVDVPDDFNPIPKQVEALEAEKKKAHAAFLHMAREIDEQISKLQAITFEAA